MSLYRYVHLALVLGALWLVGCEMAPVVRRSEVVQAAPPEVTAPFAAPLTAGPTITPTASATATASPPTTWKVITVAPPASPTPTPCRETRGTVERISVNSPVLNYPLEAHLYLPPCYAATRQRYPVVYLIHGLNFTDDQWVRLGAPTTADGLIARGEIAPAIIVMPRDRRDERLGRALVDDLVPYIDSHYRTLTDRQYRALGGLSRGGAWAIHIGLEHPELFGRLGAHSPAVFLGDEANLLQWMRYLPSDQQPQIYIDIGDKDSLEHCALWLHQSLTWFRIPHTYILQPGAHSERYWAQHMADYLRFYAAGWRRAGG